MRKKERHAEKLWHYEERGHRIPVRLGSGILVAWGKLIPMASCYRRKRFLVAAQTKNHEGNLTDFFLSEAETGGKYFSDPFLSGKKMRRKILPFFGQEDVSVWFFTTNPAACKSLSMQATLGFFTERTCAMSTERTAPCFEQENLHHIPHL